MKKNYFFSVVKTLCCLTFLLTLFVWQGYAQESALSPTSSKSQLPRATELTDAQLLEVGIKIWQNQCGIWDLPDNRKEGVTQEMKDDVTAWEDDEGDNSYALIGMIQFIWYPEGGPHDFFEDWPVAVAKLKEEGYPIKQWMLGPCPWTSKEDFMAHFNGHKMKHLRKMLSKKPLIIEQARVVAERTDAALSKILTAVDQDEAVVDKESVKQLITTRYEAVARSQQPFGLYVLMDYTSFKGEGVLATERLNGAGWGLRQVLEQMDENIIATQGPIAAFAAVANAVSPSKNPVHLAYAATRYATYLTFCLTDKTDHK